jgi:hypothetical protein
MKAAAALSGLGACILLTGLPAARREDHEEKKRNASSLRPCK